MRILLVRFDKDNRLIIKDDVIQKVYTWEKVSELHKIPSKKYIKETIRRYTYNVNFSYVSDKRIKDEGGIICWSREI